MGKGGKPRKVGKNYGDNFDRAFGKKETNEAITKMAPAANKAAAAFQVFCNALLDVDFIEFRLKPKKKYRLRSAIGLKRRK